MELLKHGYLEEAEKRELFRSMTLHEREITAALESLDLELQLDAHRGVAFWKVAQAAYELTSGDAAWVRPLVRRQRLTLEQSLLVAILRQAFVIHEQESGIGQSAAKITVNDLLPQSITYFGDSGRTAPATANDRPTPVSPAGNAGPDLPAFQTARRASG